MIRGASTITPLWLVPNTNGGQQGLGSSTRREHAACSFPRDLGGGEGWRFGTRCEGGAVHPFRANPPINITFVSVFPIINSGVDSCEAVFPFEIQA